MGRKEDKSEWCGPTHEVTLDGHLRATGGSFAAKSAAKNFLVLHKTWQQDEGGPGSTLGSGGV